MTYIRLALLAISPEGRTRDAWATQALARGFRAKNLGTASKERRAMPASQFEEQRGNPCGFPRS